MNFEPFTFILERLGQLLVDEIKFLSTDKKRLLGGLHEQLELAQSFVRDVEEEKQQTIISRVLDTEFQHVMLILPRIDDYLDTIHLEEVQQIHSKPTPFQKVKAFFSCTSNPLVHTHVVIDTAIQLTNDLENTLKRAKPYRRQSNNPKVIPKQRNLVHSHSNILNDEFIVGLDQDVETLVAKLADEHTSILAIVGMGGSGKTTLTRMVFNHQQIKGRFTDCLAWVCVSKEWDTTRILREICVQLHVPLTEGESSTAGFKLREFLHKSSCLVVLDDVWDIGALQELLPLLLHKCGGKGSGKVLVTTRIEKILHYPTLGGLHIHKPRPLTLRESWDLFSKIVRNKWKGVKSFDDESKLAIVGKEMLLKCHGLPLAIIALAGLLSTKDTIQEWEVQKRNAMARILRQNQGLVDYGPVKDMLELSYSDLCYDLQPCFLYMGIYPEDSEIDVNELIQLWIGEGLLKPNLCDEGQTLEELGTVFLNDLIQRCMVQVVRRDYEEKVVAIRLHDLMRDLCVYKAKDSRFFEIVSPSTIPSNSIHLSSRRAIIYKGGEQGSVLFEPHVRSVIRISYSYGGGGWLGLAFEKMKLLRVLHFASVDLGESAVQMGNLILLRYLSIWKCDGVTNAVLESIKNLRNLLTFNFHCKEEVMIPNDMVGGMEHLRYFCLSSGGIEFQGGALGVRRSRSLQCLRSVAGDWINKELYSVSLVNSLIELTLEYIESQEQLEAISCFIGDPSNRLQILNLKLTRSALEFDLQGMKLECCSLLKRLKLGGRVRKQERSPLFFPPNLLYLSLVGTEIHQGGDLEKALAQLHQLRHLKLLVLSYVGDELTLTRLPQLEKLRLDGLRSLKEWRVREGALPRLTHLHIHNCYQLYEISGISGIRTLQYFSVLGSSLSLGKRLQAPGENDIDNEGEGGGEDFHHICHIPEIDIDFN